MKKSWQNEDWCRTMRIRLDYTNMTSSKIDMHHGVTDDDIRYLEELGRKAHKDLWERYESGELGFMSLHSQADQIQDIKGAAERLQKRFENYVVVGIGGSALGNIALNTALNPPYYNELSREQRKNGLKVYFPDNVDPDLIRGLLNVIDLKKTVINVITKSGSTAETLANFLILKEALKEAVGDEYHRHIIVTTDPHKGLLRKLASKEDFRSFSVPENVGGRFSILSPVGLLSAAVTNVDVEELLAGAAYMHKRCTNPEIRSNPALMAAALQYLLYQKMKNIVVMMPYSQALKDIADWFRQLWAESLGKKTDRNGQVIYEGSTPVKALGATDQHSQIQLYVEGPYDKSVIFLTVEKFREQVDIPVGGYHDEDSLSYLEGSSLEKLIQTEQYATEWALTKNNRPNCKIILPEVNAFTIGQLLYMLELQTAYAGELFNVNAFDQPGVEEGKKATYALMGKDGYESLKKELLKGMEMGSDHVID
ncbi:glucose-6-phosphate isomerase [candidate division KSB1 bacterium]